MIYESVKCVLHSFANFSLGFTNYINRFQDFNTSNSCICKGICPNTENCDELSYTKLDYKKSNDYFCPKVFCGEDYFNSCKWYSCFANNLSLCKKYITDIDFKHASVIYKNIDKTNSFLFCIMYCIFGVFLLLSGFFILTKFSSRVRNKIINVLQKPEQNKNNFSIQISSTQHNNPIYNDSENTNTNYKILEFTEFTNTANVK